MRAPPRIACLLPLFKREELVKVLTERGGVIAPDDRTLIDPAKPRVTLPSPGVPVRCPAATQAKN